MNSSIFVGLMVPFLGTSLGSAAVFFMKNEMDKKIERALTGFASGAMVYVVVEELIPEMSEGEHSNIGAIMFSVGFTLMMALDTALG